MRLGRDQVAPADCELSFLVIEPRHQLEERLSARLEVPIECLRAAACRLQLRFELHARSRTGLERRNDLGMLALQRMQLRVALAQRVHHLRNGGIARRQGVAQRPRLGLRSLRFAQRLLHPPSRGIGRPTALGHYPLHLAHAVLLHGEGRLRRGELERQCIRARPSGELRVARFLVQPVERLVVGILARDALLYRAHALGERRQIERRRPGEVGRCALRVHRRAPEEEYSRCTASSSMSSSIEMPCKIGNLSVRSRSTSFD